MTANERFVRAQARVKPYPAGLPISFVYGGRKYRGLEEALFHPSIRRDEIDSRMTRTAITGISIHSFFPARPVSVCLDIWGFLPCV